MTDYKAAFRQCLASSEEYGAEQAGSVAWCRLPTFVLGKGRNSNDVWFSDGDLNSSYLALDHHIE